MIKNNLEFTGERFVPELFTQGDEIYNAHMKRYFFSCDFVRPNDQVLDISCGEGYGSALLAKNAKMVIGVDIDDDVIMLAREKYKKDNLSFAQGNAESQIFENDVFDVVVSFETLEHLTKQGQILFLKNIKNILKKNGLFVISTPDKDIYGSGGNEFHEHELSKGEFISLMKRYFTIEGVYGQCVLPKKGIFVSWIRTVLDVITQNYFWNKVKKFIPHSLKKGLDQKTAKYSTKEIESKTSEFSVEKIEEDNSAKYIVLVCKKIDQCVP